MLIHDVQVKQPSDLQALCLVSKEWNYVATESLYKTIVINIDVHNGQVGTFEECVRRGASRSLRYARSLSVYYFQQEIDRELKSETRRNTEIFERSQAIMRVLRLIPENNLHTFR
jgi:hypothetical protein